MGSLKIRTALILGFVFATAIAMAQGFQRMMIPSRSNGYTIGSQGGSIPAYCIDKGIPTPSSYDAFVAVSNTLTIARMIGNQLSPAVPLHEVLGRPGWVEIKGTFRADSLWVEPIPDTSGAVIQKFLIYTQPGKLSIASGGNLSATGWDRSKEGAYASVVKAESDYEKYVSVLDSVEEFSQKIASLYGKDSTVYLRFRTSNLTRPRLKINWALRNSDPNLARQIAAEHIYNYKLDLLTESAVDAAAAAKVFGLSLNSPKPFTVAPADLQAYISAFQGEATVITKGRFRQLVANRLAQSDKMPAAIAKAKAAIKADKGIQAYLAGAKALNRFPKTLKTLDHELKENFDFYDDISEILESVSLSQTITDPLSKIEQAVGNFENGYALLDNYASSLVSKGATPAAALALISGEPNLKSMLTTFKTKLTKWNQAFATNDPYRNLYLKSAVEAGVYEGGLTELIDNRHYLEILISANHHTDMENIRDIAELLSLERMSLLTAEQCKVLGEFLHYSIKVPSGFLKDALVIRTGNLGNELAIQIESSSGFVNTVVSAPNLSKWIQNRSKGKNLYAAPYDEKVVEILRRLKISYNPLDTLVNRAKRASFDEKVIGQGDNKITEIKHFRADKNKPFESKVLRLPSPSGNDAQLGYGDSILLRMPDKSLLLIDTGHTALAYETIRKVVGSMTDGEPVRLNVVVTHEDKDHRAGLPKLLADSKNVKLDQVFFGIGTSKSQFKNPNWWTELEKLLSDANYTKRTPPAKNIVQYDGANLPRSERLVLDAEDVYESSASKFERFSLKWADGRIDPFEDRVDLTLLSYKDPSTPNQTSIIVRTHHHYISQLLTGDIDMKVIRDLVADKGLTYYLKADILKWPHHVWWPSNAKDQADLAAFLKLVNPHTIYFSNVGAKQGELKQKTIDFIKKHLGSHVRIKWTGWDGRIDLETLVLPSEDQLAS